ncbi:hypothetical protein ACH4GM_31530 [Streptomyces coeruleorubidus]|uniref:hypothetical protein n=1 Tax=Streptomyces coeruleorubidus TaxID=116188 RepID=UPI00379EC2F2
MVKQRGPRSRRTMWWFLLLLGTAIGVCGFLGGTRYYSDPATENLGNLAFWGMLASGCLAFFAAMHLVQPAVQRGLARFFGGIARRSAGRQSTAQSANPDRRDAV